MRLKQFVLSMVTATALFAGPKEDPNASQIVDLRKKISEYTEKTSKANDKISSTKSEANSERQAQQKYRENFASELARLDKEKNELAGEKQKLGRGSDSLSQKISSIQSSTKELELRQLNFVKTAIEAVDIYRVALAEFPAPLLYKERESLAFLRRELSSGSISASEGVERLWQIIQAVNRGRLTVDVWQAVSAWEKITGQVHYVRIGFAWLGMVNDQGSSGAIWTGANWQVVNDPVQLTTLRTAVKVRSGNAVPALLNLPLAIQTKAVTK